MKNFTIALLSIAVLFTDCKEKSVTTSTSNTETTLTKYSATDFTKKEVMAYNKIQYHLILENLYAKVADSTITAYKDEELKEKLSPIEFDKMHSTMQMVQAPNPASPNDPFDLIDTLILSPIKMWELKGLTIDKNKDLFVFEVTDTTKAYFKWNEMSSILNTEQLAYLDLLLESNKGLLSYTSIKDFGEDFFKKIAKQLYSWGTEEGGLKAFESYKFERGYSPQEAKDKGVVSEMFKVPNPDNLDDPSDVIDSTKFTPFNSDSINTLRAYFVWKSNKDINTTVNLLAFSPLYSPVTSGYKLPMTPLFLLKATEVNEKLNSVEKAYITYFSLALTRNAGSYKGNYGSASFKSTEYWE